MVSKKLVFTGRALNQSGARSLVRNPGDTALVERGVLRTLVMACPCGCGDVITVNLDKRADKAWRIYLRPAGLTLYPSVWRDTGCESHFVVWNDRILWGIDDSWEPSYSARDELRAGILQNLYETEYVFHEDIAKTLDEIPWAILDASRHLVRLGAAEERSGKERGWFRKRGAVARPSESINEE